MDVMGKNFRITNYIFRITKKNEIKYDLIPQMENTQKSKGNLSEREKGERERDYNSHSIHEVEYRDERTL